MGARTDGGGGSGQSEEPPGKESLLGVTERGTGNRDLKLSLEVFGTPCARARSGAVFASCGRWLGCPWLLLWGRLRVGFSHFRR